jgi:hypothetical protein
MFHRNENAWELLEVKMGELEDAANDRSAAAGGGGSMNPRGGGGSMTPSRTPRPRTPRTPSPGRGGAVHVACSCPIG